MHTFGPTLNDNTADSVRAVPGLLFRGTVLSHIENRYVLK